MPIQMQNFGKLDSLDVPRAQRQFTDREEPRESFWKFYRKLESEMAVPAPDGSLAAKFYVLNFYGAGGLGKTRLREKLKDEMKETASGLAAVYDFDRSKNHRATDMLTVLTGLRTAISDASKEQGTEEFQFPMFNLAYYYYNKKLGMVSTDPTAKNTFLSNHPIVDSGLEIASAIVPGLEIVAHTADSLFSIFSRRHGEKATEKLRWELSGLEAVGILNRLPYYFTRDMTDNMQRCKKPLVVFLDTYEDLVNPLSGKNDYVCDDLWLRRTSSGYPQPEYIAPIPNIPGVLWVILGRNKLNWLDADPNWEGTLECHILDCLEEPDAVSFLTVAGVTDKDLCHKLFLLTGGYPMYLDLCVNILEHIWALGRVPTIEDFGNNREGMVSRLLRYMGNSQADLVRRLACLDNWDDALLSALFSEAQRIEFRSATRNLSFICLEDGVYTMHNMVQELLLAGDNYCPPAPKAEVWEQAETYYGKQLDILSPQDSQYDAVFTAFSRYGLRRRECPEELADFYQTKLKDKVDRLLELCKGAPVLQCAQTLLAHPAAYSSLLVKAGNLSTYVYLTSGQYQQAAAYGEKAYQLAIEDLGEDHPATLNAMKLLADSYFHLRRRREARELREKILERRTALLGEEHPDTLKAMLDLANSYFDLGHRYRTIKLQKKVLACQTALLGEDHPDTLNTMGNLAASYSIWDGEGDAIELQKKVLERRTSLLGETHPDTLRAMDDLADYYFNLENIGYCDAMNLREKILERRTAFLGEKHPDTLRTMASLADSYFSMRQPQKAIELKRKVLEHLIALLGEDHPDTFDAMDDLADLYSKLGVESEALNLWKRSQELRDVGPDKNARMNKLLMCKPSLLEEEMPTERNTLRSAINSCNYRELGRLLIGQDSHILEHRTSILGENHPDTLRAMANLAESDFCEGGVSEQIALGLREKLVERSTAALGEDHPDTLRAMGDLADSYSKLGRKQDALEMWKKVAEDQTAILGAGHPDTLRAVNHLADCYSELEQIPEWTALWERAVEDRATLLGGDHPATIDAINYLATTYLLLERTQDTIELLKKHRISHPGDHPETFTAISNLAVLYYRLGWKEDAMELLEKVLDRQTALLGESHPDTLGTMDNLEDVYSDLGLEQEAKRLREKRQELPSRHDEEKSDTKNSDRTRLWVELMAKRKEEILERRTALLGEGHPAVLSVMDKLADLYWGLGQKQAALALQKKAAEGQIALLGAAHPKVFDAIEHLSESYFDLEQFQDAAELWEKAVASLTALLGEEHYLTVAAMMNLEDAYSELGQEQKAEELYEKILKAQRLMYDDKTAEE